MQKTSCETNLFPSSFQNSFFRTEKKYLLTKAQYDKIFPSLKKNFKTDQYGQQTICNLYFDTSDFILINQSLEKPPYKEKLRLRSYGVPTNDSTVFLEIKKKYNGIVGKRRIALSYKDAKAYVLNDLIPPADLQILKEIEYFRQCHEVTPAALVVYDRIAYYDLNDPHFRLTVDTNIRSSFTCLDLQKIENTEPLFDQPYFLLEIKALKAIPLWLVHLLNNNQIYPTSFSKYGRIYEAKQIMKRVC